jgi:protein subunit release factor A
VVLVHLPTGLIIKVHDTREQSANRKIARTILYNKLDTVVNPETSKEVLSMNKELKSKIKKEKRRRIRD